MWKKKRAYDHGLSTSLVTLQHVLENAWLEYLAERIYLFK